MSFLIKKTKSRLSASFPRSTASRFLGLLITYLSLLILPASADSGTIAEVLILCYFYNAAGLVVNLGKDWELKVDKNIHLPSLELSRHLGIVFLCSSAIVVGLFIALFFVSPTKVFYSAFSTAKDQYSLFITLLTLTMSGWSKLAIAFCQRVSRSSVNFLLDAYPIMAITVGIIVISGFGYAMPSVQVLAALAYCSQLILVLIIAKRYIVTKTVVDSPLMVPRKRFAKYAYAGLGISTVAVGIVINIAPSIFLGSAAYNYWSYALRLSFAISLFPSIIYNQMPFNLHKQGSAWSKTLNSIRKRSFLCSSFCLPPVLIIALPFLQLILKPASNIVLSTTLALGIYLIILSEFANVAFGPNDFILAFYRKEHRVFLFKVLSLLIYAVILLSALVFGQVGFLALAFATVGQAFSFNFLCMVESKKYLPYA